MGLGPASGNGERERKAPATGPAAAQGTPGLEGPSSGLSPASPAHPHIRLPHLFLSSWRHLLGAVDPAALHLLNRRRPREGSGERDWNGEGLGRRGIRWGASESSREAAGGSTRIGCGS